MNDTITTGKLFKKSVYIRTDNKMAQLVTQNGGDVYITMLNEDTKSTYKHGLSEKTSRILQLYFGDDEEEAGGSKSARKQT